MVALFVGDLRELKAASRGLIVVFAQYKQKIRHDAFLWS
jgi:hypothetical protein